MNYSRHNNNNNSAVLLRNRYELLSNDSEEDENRLSVVPKKKKKKNYCNSDATIDRYVNSVMKETNGINNHGKPIDKQVLKNYLQQVEESEGFDIRDFPGSIYGVTSIFPSQDLLDNPERRPDHYEKVMYLAVLSLAVYNKKCGRRFKLRKMEKLNVMLSGRVLNYYITFSGVEVNGIQGPVLSDLLWSLMGCFKWIIMTLVYWLWCFLSLQLEHGFNKKCLKLKMEHYLKDLTIHEGELACDSANYKTFQASVTDDMLAGKEKVKFCREFGTISKS